MQRPFLSTHPCAQQQPEWFSCMTEGDVVSPPGLADR